MSTTNKIIIAIVAVVVIAAGVWLFIGNKSSAPSSTTPATSGQDNASVALTITYDGTSFTPATATVKAGSKIKVVNQSSKPLEFASNPHPIHTDDTELNIGDVDPDTSKTFTVTTPGAWGFHNHYDSGKGGTLTVE